MDCDDGDVDIMDDECVDGVCIGILFCLWGYELFYFDLCFIEEFSGLFLLMGGGKYIYNIDNGMFTGLDVDVFVMEVLMMLDFEVWLMIVDCLEIFVGMIFKVVGVMLFFVVLLDDIDI